MRGGGSPSSWRGNAHGQSMASAANTTRRRRMAGSMMLLACSAFIVLIAFREWMVSFSRRRWEASLSGVQFAQKVRTFDGYEGGVSRSFAGGNGDAISSSEMSNTMFAGTKTSASVTVAAMRDRLNGLVEESVSRTDQQLTNIAFIKTHKTASTTLASILYRYGKRHGSKISKFKEGGTFVELDSAARQVTEQGERVDIMHYHHAWNGFYKGTWTEAREKYSKIMSDKAEVNFVTVLREPVAHYLSYYYYFINPLNKMSIQQYLMEDPTKKLLYNPMAAEFGIDSMAQMNDFIRNEMTSFKMVVLTERFDEGLTMLQKMMGWDPVDMTYCPMLPTKKGMRRWDGKPLENIPKISELPLDVVTQIRARTQLDTRLYQAGILLYRMYKIDFGPGLDDYIEDFQSVQRIMHRYLELNSTSEAIKWYVGDVDIYNDGPSVLRF